MNDFTRYVILFATFAFPIILWCGIMMVAGRLSGWLALADRYRCTEPFEGQRWHFQSAQLRWATNYSGILTVGVSAEGMFVSPMIFFRVGHPTLFIPWSAMQMEMKQSRWQGEYMEIRFPEVPGTLMRISARLARKIATAVGPQLPQAS